MDRQTEIARVNHCHLQKEKLCFISCVAQVGPESTVIRGLVIKLQLLIKLIQGLSAPEWPLKVILEFLKIYP